MREGSEKKFIICGERVLRDEFICKSKKCNRISTCGQFNQNTCTSIICNGEYCSHSCENSCNTLIVKTYYHYFYLTV